MPISRHEKYVNCIHFVTVVTFQRIKFLTNSKYCQFLLSSLDFYRKKYKFKLLGYVIMPNHCHFLIWVDNEKGNISEIMHGWKSYAAQIILKDVREGAGRMPAPQGKDDLITSWVAGILPATITSLWRKRFYTFPIWDEDKLAEKLTYIHNNPRRAGLVKNLDDYPWSSYQNYYLKNDALIDIDLDED